jgi:Uma2 family endonuclease
MSTVPKRYITTAEYLAIERRADVKSEYFNGEMFAMTGASRRHNVIAGNTYRRIHEQLDGRPCEIYMSDMRVKVNSTGLYTYPDLVVVCGEPRFEDAEVDTLVNPNTVIEILSDSTEAYDRGRKFEHYRQIESLREYLLIAQDHVHVEQFVREQNERWVLTETDRLESSVVLATIDCPVRLSDIYDRISFEASSE